MPKRDYYEILGIHKNANETEIKKMVRDAESHAEEDKKKKELVEVRNEADTLIYSIEKSLTDYGDKISESERADIQSAIEEAKKAKDGEDVQAIRNAMQKLSNVSHKLAEEIYKKAGAQGAGGAQPGPESGAGEQAGGESGGSTGGEKVVDAEFEEKK